METTHAGAMGLWSKMPLPIAELGLKLDPRGKDYLDQLLRVLDAGLRVGLAIGLARARRSGAPPALLKSVLPFFVNPTLGKRSDAIAVLQSALPGVTGWNLDQRVEDLAPLADVLDGGHRGRPPKIRESLERLAKIRNDEKHWALTLQRAAEVRGPLGTAVLSVLRSSTELARGHMLILRSVRRMRPGEVECEAWSLRGASRAVLQRTQPLRFSDESNLIEGRVYWQCEDGTILPLSPFVVAPPSPDGLEPVDEPGVYLLDRIERRTVVRRRPLTHEILEPGDDAELDASLPGWREAYAQAGPRGASSDVPASPAGTSSSHTHNAWEVVGTEDPTVAKVPSEPPVLPRPRLPVHWLAGGAGAIVLASAAVAVWWWASGVSPDHEESNAPAVASSAATRAVQATRNCPARWTWLAGVSNQSCMQTFEATWRDVRSCTNCAVTTPAERLAALGRRADLCTSVDEEPANCVSPDAAEAVCRSIGFRDLRVSTGRLPTAAEWKNAAQWPDLDAPVSVLARANLGAFNLCDSSLVQAYPAERCVLPTLLDGGARIGPQAHDRWARVAPGNQFPEDRVNGLFDVHGNLSEFVRLDGGRWGAAGRSFLSGIAEGSGALVVGPRSRHGGLAADDFGAQYGFRCIVPLAP